LIDAAERLVTPLIPTPTEEEAAARLVKGSEVYAQYGWTGLHNMSVPWSDVLALETLADSDAVGIRVYNSIDPEAAEYLFEGGMRENNNRRIITRAIKLYMDGALGSRGAALIEPYADANT